jgi:hypothetical protein
VPVARVAVLLLSGALLCATFLRASADPAERTSTLDDQRSVNVTIYNSGLGLVHDRRRIALEEGENRLAWRDVSAQMDPTSALLESLTAPAALTTLEQNFNFDLLSYDALVSKAVGQKVTVVHPYERLPADRRESATLLSVTDGPLLQYADRIDTLRYGSFILFTALPAGLRDRPTLVLALDSARAGAQDVELSYLTAGLGWHADYVGRLSADGNRLDLHGLVTLTNTSGTPYRSAHVQLVAGNVNVVSDQSTPEGTVRSADSYAPAPPVQQESFFEYHLYTLNRPTTIEQNQTKQVDFMNARRIPVRESLELRGSPYYYTSMQPDLGEKLPVGAYLSFNNKGGDLGVPLPGGVVRLYKTDSHGITQFIGSDSIDHTPKNEEVRLFVGSSFDVTARKKQTDYHVMATSHQSSYQIVLGNAKTQPVEVLVVEPIPGDWRMLRENLPHTKSSSSTASWRVRVPAGSHTTLTYTVLVK